MGSYTFFQWLMFFYIYCFIGWCFESSYVSLKQRHWVNRGFLTLPMLPIYGSGALAILVVTIPVRGNYVLVYIFGLLSSTILELITGAVMESMFKVKYWDYSNQKFNFKGYICLSSSIAWGFMSVLLTEVIHNPIEKLVLNMNHVLMGIILGVVSVLFIADTVASFKAAWDLRKVLEKVEQLKVKAEEVKAQLAEMAQEKKDSLAEKSQEFAEKVQEKREEFAEKTQEKKQAIAEKSLEKKEEAAARLSQSKEALETSWKELMEKLELQKGQVQKEHSISKFFMRAKLRNNPGATSKKFGATLSELKERAGRRKKDNDEVKGN